jgi:outer membrane protein OmpA-like peptidoglycan-associated protein
MLVDAFGKKVYTGLVPAGDTSPGAIQDCICSDTEGLSGYVAGEARVIYQVVAALPDSTRSVDVVLAGQVIGNVKVDSGPMTPEVDASKPILVGMGWPKVDQAVVTSSAEPEKSVFDLTTSVADLEQTMTTRATPKQISVALASDVLFATDLATLSPKAKALLLRAAAEVKAAGGSGALQVVGYTDNTGSTSHNVDLSRRRAAAVAAAMKPLLPTGVQLPVSGKGEADPVAPNNTVGGRSLNRRVSLIFAPQGGAK